MYFTISHNIWSTVTFCMTSAICKTPSTLYLRSPTIRKRLHFDLDFQSTTLNIDKDHKELHVYASTRVSK